MKKKMLKLVAFAALVLLCASVFCVASFADDRLPGDMNRDGKVNSTDARIILRIAAKLDSVENYTDAATADARLPGDMNRDGKVNSTDARVVLRIAAKLDSVENYMDKPSAFPIGKWENEQSVYTFNVDGSGEIISKDGKTGVPLMYEVSADTNTRLRCISAALTTIPPRLTKRPTRIRWCWFTAATPIRCPAL